MREDDLIEKPLRIENGYGEVPKEPGLEAELDEDAIKKYSIAQGAE